MPIRSSTLIQLTIDRFEQTFTMVVGFIGVDNSQASLVSNYDWSIILRHYRTQQQQELRTAASKVVVISGTFWHPILFASFLLLGCQ